VQRRVTGTAKLGIELSPDIRRLLSPDIRRLSLDEVQSNRHFCRMRNLLLRTGLSLVVCAVTSCTVPPPEDPDAQPDGNAQLWNLPHATPLACTTVHTGGGNTGPIDLPNDPTPGNGPVIGVQSLESGFSTLSADDVANLDGGAGNQIIYSDIVKVTSPKHLSDVLASGFRGTIIIPRDVDWDMTPFKEIQIKSHVALRGERGDLCSRPILRSTRLTKNDMLTIVGSDVLIEGIHFIGPMNGERTAGTMGNTTAVKMHVYNYSDVRNRYIRIRDNEMREWTAAGVEVSSTRRDESVDDWPANVEKPSAAFAKDIVIEQNFLHHNSRDGGGYGVSVGNAAHALVQGNVFEANRHAIASNGRPYSGYQAKFNYVQEGGFRDNGSYQQHFDVHGMGDNHYGGIAGQYYEISNNTFRGEQDY
jgi:hypothetical protein